MFSKLILLAAMGTTIAKASVLNLANLRVCYEDEPTDLICYTEPDSVPQDVDIEDVAYIAAYLRAYGGETRLGRLFSMSAEETPDCGEWTLYQRGTALAVAKHVDNTVDSSVLFRDIATTIDGGPNATPEEQEAAIMGCMSDGGSLGVLVDESAPAYSNPSYYPEGYVTDGILIKIVSSGA